MLPHLLPQETAYFPSSIVLPVKIVRERGIVVGTVKMKTVG